MAFSEAEKVSIRRHLGLNSAAAANYPWVDTFHAVNEILTNTPAATETEARAILTRLTDIETRLSGALDRLQASTVGSINLNARETSQLRGELKRWRSELSTLLGVPMARVPGGIMVA